VREQATAFARPHSALTRIVHEAPAPPGSGARFVRVSRDSSSCLDSWPGLGDHLEGAAERPLRAGRGDGGGKGLCRMRGGRCLLAVPDKFERIRALPARTTLGRTTRRPTTSRASAGEPSSKHPNSSRATCIVASRTREHHQKPSTFTRPGALHRQPTAHSDRVNERSALGTPPRGSRAVGVLVGAPARRPRRTNGPVDQLTRSSERRNARVP